MVSVPFYKVAGKVSLRRKCLNRGDYTDTRGEEFSPAVGSGYAKTLHVSKLAVLERKQESDY